MDNTYHLFPQVVHLTMASEWNTHKDDIAVSQFATRSLAQSDNVNQTSITDLTLAQRSAAARSRYTLTFLIRD